MELSDIVQVKETNNEHEANELLESGWILLSSGFFRGSVPGYDRHSYSFGLPKHISLAMKDNDKHKYDYGF